MLDRSEQAGRVVVVKSGDGVAEVDGDPEVDGLGAAGGGHIGLGSLLFAVARLILSPSVSPVQFSRSASVVRARRLSRMSSRRLRWGAILRRGSEAQ
jgi:hypothetical protein